MRGQVGHRDCKTPVEILISHLDMSPKLSEDMLVDHKQRMSKPWVQNKLTEKHKVLQVIFEENHNLRAG